MGTIDSAIQVALLAPLDIVRDYQVEFAITVVVDPGSAGREFIRSPHAGDLRHIGEGAISIVVEEMALAEAGNEKIVEAVVIVVANCYAEAVHRYREAGFAGYVRERAVVVIVVQLWRCRSRVGVSREILAVDQEDVGIT